uniref:eukaryotic translation initiation factor 1-like n=1 Tax=Callithrix jacchus TaxID=9483 RepID=UPI0023DD346B|nr:eukaryotic translation initiation factor 1-like [Callithrix jacchus]
MVRKTGRGNTCPFLEFTILQKIIPQRNKLPMKTGAQDLLHALPSPLPAFSCRHRHRPFPPRKRNCIRSPLSQTSEFNPFADASKGDDPSFPAGTEDYIHIRIQQRNGRKTLTIVQGIADDDYDKKKLVKALKKFACNGTVTEHPECGEAMQLQDDQRRNIRQFLLGTGLAKDDQLKVHGF